MSRAVVVALIVLAGARPAAAHVDVLPTRAVEGEATEFEIRVPTERELPTTRVEATFPDGVTVFALAEPPLGWRARARAAPDGSLAGAVWSGGQIGAERYLSFHVLGTPTAAGRAVWRFRQTYADGLVKPWSEDPPAADAASPETGPAEPGPAAAVEVVAARPAAGGAPAAAASDDDSGAGVWLGLIAIGIAALAALGTGLLWSTRPARLPDDERDA